MTIAMRYIYKKIWWVFGPASSGKTTLLHRCNKICHIQNLRAFFLSDFDELLVYIRSDTKCLYHTKLTNGQFRITDMSIYDQIIKNLCQKVEQVFHKYDFIGIEISCGKGRNKNFPLAFEKRLSLIQPYLLYQSLIVFMKSSLQRRIQYNTTRKYHIRTPDQVIDDYFMDDSYTMSKSIKGLDCLIYENMHTKEHLYAFVERIFNA